MMRSMTNDQTRSPGALSVGGKVGRLQKLAAEDRNKLTAFIATMPPHDLLYVNRDVTEPKVIDAWIEAETRGSMITTLAMLDDQVIGVASLVRDPLSWSPHVGEIRVMVGPEVRRAGVGRALINESFAHAASNDILKLVAHMTVDQRGAFAIFEALGFYGEALMKNHVRDANGKMHDIAIMACMVEELTVDKS